MRKIPIVYSPSSTIKTVLVIGARGGIGAAIVELFQRNGMNVIPLTREELDLSSVDCDSLLDYFLSQRKPDIVINCAGVYSTKVDISSNEMLAVNVGSNWSIIKHFWRCQRSVRIIMLGSSSYQKGKPQHMLYAASKAALHNLWEGAKEYFSDTPVKIDIVHPVRTRTPMVENTFDPKLDYLDPSDVARIVWELCEEDQESRCIKISFEDKK